MQNNDKIPEFNREVSCFFVPMNSGVLSLTTDNTSGAVEFDFFSIWEQLKKIKPNYVCMIHSHPPSHPKMSGIDWTMVYGWCQAIGKPIMFVVVSNGGHPSAADFGAKRTCYWCERDPENKSKINRTIVPVSTNADYLKIERLVWFLSTYDEDLDESVLRLQTKIIQSTFVCPCIGRSTPYLEKKLRSIRA